MRLVEYDVETTVKTSRLRAYKQPETEAIPALYGEAGTGAA